jgi:predicted DNA-binding transcriptional regulator
VRAEADLVVERYAGEDSLKGTTLRVYRLLLKSRAPMGIHDVQRALELSSASVAQYHIRKLQDMKLIKEEQGGYVIDKVVFENVIRIRRTAIPLQTAYVAFFAASLAVMLTILRPASLTSMYLFALVAITFGLVTTACEAARSFTRL